MYDRRLQGAGKCDEAGAIYIGHWRAREPGVEGGGAQRLDDGVHVLMRQREPISVRLLQRFPVLCSEWLVDAGRPCNAHAGCSFYVCLTLVVQDCTDGRDDGRAAIAPVECWYSDWLPTSWV